jgi:flagellin
MPLTIATNVFALIPQSQLTKTTGQLTKVYERLSSGLRINRASDDAAGVAMAADLTSASAKMAVALRNTNDGISLASTADAAMAEIELILNRMSELATQASNSTYTYANRVPLQSEYAALGSEIERIANSTTFNGLALLKNASSVTIQVGIDGTSSSQVVIAAASGDLNSLGIGTSGGAYSTYIDQQSTATTAITSISTALQRITAQRGVVGAAMSRLSYSASVLTRQKDNLSTAVSSIRDADLAADSAELVRLQVLQQSQTAILGQANQQPSLILKLLG